MDRPNESTVKRLLLRTSNRCAFPGCSRPLFDKADHFVAQICHICGERPKAKRYDPSQTDAERHGYDNLIVLCPTHHTVIDTDELTYTVEALHDMKRQHEARSRQDFVIPDRVAKQIILFMGAAAITRGIGDIVREIRGVAGAVSDAMGQTETEAQRFERELVAGLRYVPSGVLVYHSEDPAHRDVCMFLVGVFKAAGWRVAQAENATAFKERHPFNGRSPIVFIFFVMDKNQIRNTSQAIRELLDKCGFVAHDDIYEGTGKVRGIPILVAYETRRPATR